MDRVRGRILVSRDTTENWNGYRTFIPLKGEIIVYTDFGHITDDLGNEVDVPGIKIGDGNAYLIDLPFVGDDTRDQILQELRNHTSNTYIHVTPEEKEFWNNKLDYTVSSETLIFTRQ